MYVSGFAALMLIEPVAYINFDDDNDLAFLAFSPHDKTGGSYRYIVLINLG